MHAVELGAGDRDPAGFGARRYQQSVVCQLAAVGERNPRLGGVDPGHGGAGVELDLMVLVEALLVDVGLLAL